ncbi:MAG: GNAT family N-acetyltransferase [Flavipsychrobacter sp.]|nr:GNAT family N-acetyltransferase [Flavipsychrobacter sp.]
MNWLKAPIVLQGVRVRLEPLASSHFPALVEIGKNKNIWTHLPVDGSDGTLLEQELKSALVRKASGEEYPFAIIDVQSGNAIGSTRFYNIYPEHRKLEIGWTWYHPGWWGKGHNIECKYLLLRYCFEEMAANRVQLQTSEENLRSRAAILKIGATFEGILRKERIRPNGTTRNSAIFSIIDDEWPQVKAMLEARIAG